MLKPTGITATIAILGILGLGAPVIASPYRVYSPGNPGFSRGVVIPQLDNHNYGDRYYKGYNRPGLTIITGETICLNCRPNVKYYHHQRGYPFYHQRGRSNSRYGRGYNHRYY